jgi:serine/threonine-protein kinase
LFAHIQQPPPDPREIVPDVPRAVAYAIMRALSKNPEDRFASAGEMMHALALG